MPSYTVQQLRDDGPQFAMAMLLRCISSGEPFVTYGNLREELQYQLGIDKIFPTQIGEVAGKLMDTILLIDPKAPLINVLITRGNGIPGTGAGYYLAERYKQKKLANWDKVKNSAKLALIERERNKVFKYRKWDIIYNQLFTNSARKKLRPVEEKESDYSGKRFGGAAESKEHKKLKGWVAADPTRIGLSKLFGEGSPEYGLLSGDEVDVMFQRGNSYRAVEVKSIKSADHDLKRGIYQCVKYREVKVAEAKPFFVDVQAILVTERDLPEDLKERARINQVKTKTVSINKIK